MVARCSLQAQGNDHERTKQAEGSSIFIAKDFYPRVSEIRKTLTRHVKTARNQGKRVTMITAYDHLLIDDKKFVLDNDNELKELTITAGPVISPLQHKPYCHAAVQCVC